jgi:hypothetical protein
VPQHEIVRDQHVFEHGDSEAVHRARSDLGYSAELSDNAFVGYREMSFGLNQMPPFLKIDQFSHWHVSAGAKRLNGKLAHAETAKKSFGMSGKLKLPDLSRHSLH